MTNKFAERITTLRKQRGWSQKDASKKLGISQALLSHYEKGIRECGLDFVMNASKVYSCSCDYLLGVTDKLSIDDSVEDNDNIIGDLEREPKLLQNRNSVLNTINLLYSITARLGNTKIHNDFTMLVYSEIYAIVRILEKTYFSGTLFHGNTAKWLVFDEEIKTISKSSLLNSLYKEGVDISLTKAKLTKEYPVSSAAMFNIIQTIETIIDKKIEV